MKCQNGELRKAAFSSCFLMTKRARQGEKQGRQTDKDGYKTKKKVPAKRQPKTPLVDGKSQPLIAHAVKQNWLDDDTDRWETDLTVKELQRREKENGLNAKERAMLAILTDLSGRDYKQRQQAVRNLISMESQNQSDQHFEVSQATPELHVHGHRHLNSPTYGTDAATIVEAIDSILTERGIDPDITIEADTA